METDVHEWLRSMCPVDLSRTELCDGLEVLHRLAQHISERSMAFTAAIDALDDGGLDGASTRRSVTHESSRHARREAKTAGALQQMPEVAESLAAGQITVEHAEICADAAENASPEVATELLAEAKRKPADRFRRDAREAVAKRQRERDIEAEHRRQRRARELIEFTDDDGMACFLLRMDHQTAQLVRGRLAERVERLWRADGGRDGTPDDVRLPGQRRLDALVGLINEDKASDDQTIPPRLMIHIVFEVPDGTATWPDGTPVPAEVLVELGPTAEIIGHVFTSAGTPLYTGRSNRLASRGQWRSLIASCRGCVECAAPVSMTEAHHIDHWETSRNSDITNLELRCHRCHGLAHHASRGDPRYAARAGPGEERRTRAA